MGKQRDGARKREQYTISAPVTEAEKDAVRTRATRLGMTVSTLVYRCVFAEPPIPRVIAPSALEHQALCHALRLQIMGGGFVDAQQLADIIALGRELITEARLELAK